MKERAVGLSPERLPEKAFSLVHATEEDWKKMWQDRKFTSAFPSLAKWTVSEGKEVFSNEQRRSLFTLGIKSFMDLPWAPIKGSLSTHGFVFARDGNIIAMTYLETLAQGQKIDYESPLRANLAFLLLLGLSTASRDDISRVLDHTCQTTPTKQRSLRDQMSQLFTINNLSRAWIKQDQLDFLNDFDWDKEVPELMLNLPLLRIDPAKGKRQPLPYEMEFEVKKHYSKEVILVFLNHAIKYIEELGVPPKSKRFGIFIKEVADFLSEHRDATDQNLIAIGQKLARLSLLVY